MLNLTNGIKKKRNCIQIYGNANTYWKAEKQNSGIVCMDTPASQTIGCTASYKCLLVAVAFCLITLAKWSLGEKECVVYNEYTCNVSLTSIQDCYSVREQILSGY